jgi:AbrB family looped-hinge helix DNA binding protein
LLGMTRRVGAKGQVVIPKDVREQVGLHPGTEVDVTAQGESVVVTVHRPASPLGGRFAGSGMAGRLLRDRAAEPR